MVGGKKVVNEVNMLHGYVGIVLPHSSDVFELETLEDITDQNFFSILLFLVPVALIII